MLYRISSFILITLTLVACSENPVTGRRQFKLVPERELQAMASQQYQSFLSQNRAISPSADKDAEMVRRVGNRIATAVTQYYRSQKLGKVLEGYRWEFNLINDKDANAWAMPGGKVVIYTGLLPITRNEAALANVIGHEISHAIFQHGNERMSQGLAQQFGGAALSVAVANRPQQTQNLFLQAYGIGSTVGVLLPFSRRQESEADRFGMRWAALAGYNPREAIALWQRMASAAKSSRPPEILSTHPAEERRIADLKRHLPEALKYYRPRK